MKSKIFENLIIFFSLNIGNNNKIMYIFLNTFERLLNDDDKQIADNLNKRGIIKDGVFYFLLYLNDKQKEEDLVLKKCEIIISYFDVMYDSQNESNNTFDKEDYLLFYKFKEIISSGQLDISDILLKLYFI